MSVERINGFRYTCDNCGKEHIGEGDGGYYPEGVPPDWCRTKFTAHRRVEATWLLCDDCVGTMLRGRSLTLTAYLFPPTPAPDPA